MGAPWVKKYSPENLKQVIGQASQMSVLKTFIENYKGQKKKAILIHGPSGCGKTSCVYALAGELGMEIVELNSSDFRNKDQINSIAGAASRQMSLFGMGKLILIDELDGISGRKDYGGVAALVKVIMDSAFPVVITANNPYDNKFSSVRNKSEMLQFKGLEPDDVFDILKKICVKEGINHSEDALKMIARRSAGDARGAVNDLEIIASLGDEISRQQVEELSERNKTETIINALLKILKGTDPVIAKDAFNNVEEDLNECALWLDENLPKEYVNPPDLARAYDNLSRADVFNGRIRRWQHWRFLSYVGALMTAGVAVSKDSKNKEFIQYKPTGRILKMWWAKQKNMKKKAIAAKIALKTHASVKEVLKNIEFFRIIFKEDKTMADAISKELELNNEEIGYLSSR